MPCAPNWCSLPAPAPANVSLHSLATRLDAVLAYANIQRAPSTLLDDIQTMWTKHRCGIVCFVRNGFASVLPFANTEYRNKWADACTPVDARGHVMTWDAFRDDFSRVFGGATFGDVGARDRWWTNGNVVCSIPPTNVWGTSQLNRLLSVLGAACVDVAHADVVLNRRDGPIEDGLATPVLSFYGVRARAEDTHGVCTRVIPNYEDLSWHEHNGGGPVALTPLTHRKAVCLWRGSLTGAGVLPTDNARLMLATFTPASERADAFDMALTSVPKRLRVYAIGDKHVVTFPRMRTTCPGLRCRPSIPMHEWAHAAVTVYVHGHSGATRFLSQLALGGLVIHFDPELSAYAAPRAPTVWGQTYAMGVSGGAWASEPDAGTRASMLRHATHMVVTSTEELERVVVAVFSNVAEAQAVATNGANMASALMCRPFMAMCVQRALVGDAPPAVTLRNGTVVLPGDRGGRVITGNVTPLPETCGA